MTNLKGSPAWCPKIPVQIHLLKVISCTFDFLPVSALGGWGGWQCGKKVDAAGAILSLSEFSNTVNLKLQV